MILDNYWKTKWICFFLKKKTWSADREANYQSIIFEIETRLASETIKKDELTLKLEEQLVKGIELESKLNEIFMDREGKEAPQYATIKYIKDCESTEIAPNEFDIVISDLKSQILTLTGRKR